MKKAWASNHGEMVHCKMAATSSLVAASALLHTSHYNSMQHNLVQRTQFSGKATS